jgi:hypothetical protein
MAKIMKKLLFSIAISVLLSAVAFAHESDVWVDATYPSGPIVGSRSCGWAGEIWKMESGELRPVLFNKGHLHYPNPDHPYKGGMNCDDLVKWQIGEDE